MAPLDCPIFIDALNVAYWCGRPPSLRLPLALLADLLARGQSTRLYFDASAPHQLRAEAEVYARLRACVAYVVEVRSGIPADRVLLRHAVAQGACVLSRDQFRDQRRRYRRLIDDPARLIAGDVAHDRLRVPALAVEVRLPVTADEAWALLLPWLGVRTAAPPD